MRKETKRKTLGYIGFSLITISLMGIAIFGTSIYYKGFYASGDDYSKLIRVNDIIDELYYEDYDLDKVNEGAVRGMIDELGDPYSTYLSSEEIVEFKQALDNQYVGIGVQIESTKDYTYVTRVFDNTPALEAGVEVGDVFSTVNGESVYGYNAYEISSLVRGEEGTNVKITFIRPGFESEVELDIKRSSYTLDSLEFEMFEDNVGYIKIIDFTSTIYNEFSDAYDKLEKQGMDSLIIDVRDNGGGYLDQVTKIADLFVDSSKPIYQEKTRNNDASLVYGTSNNYDVDVALLINNNSASASELLAASLNEINGSPLVGTTTFGKGTAQRTVPIGDGSEIKITYAQWLTPDGNWIHDVGINPTVELEINEEHYYRKVLISEDLKFDLVGDQVLNAQHILNISGYEVRQDGYYDKNMENTIKDFQKDNGVTVTGVINHETANVLNEKLELYLNDYRNDSQIMRAIEELK